MSNKKPKEEVDGPYQIEVGESAVKITLGDTAATVYRTTNGTTTESVSWAKEDRRRNEEQSALLERLALAAEENSDGHINVLRRQEDDAEETEKPAAGQDTDALIVQIWEAIDMRDQRDDYVANTLSKPESYTDLSVDQVFERIEQIEWSELEEKESPVVAGTAIQALLSKIDDLHDTGGVDRAIELTVSMLADVKNKDAGWRYTSLLIDRLTLLHQEMDFDQLVLDTDKGLNSTSARMIDFARRVGDSILGNRDLKHGALRHGPVKLISSSMIKPGSKYKGQSLNTIIPAMAYLRLKPEQLREYHSEIQEDDFARETHVKDLVKNILDVRSKQKVGKGESQAAAYPTIKIAIDHWAKEYAEASGYSSSGLMLKSYWAVYSAAISSMNESDNPLQIIERSEDKDGSTTSRPAEILSPTFNNAGEILYAVLQLSRMGSPLISDPSMRPEQVSHQQNIWLIQEEIVRDYAAALLKKPNSDATMGTG